MQPGARVNKTTIFRKSQYRKYNWRIGDLLIHSIKFVHGEKSRYLVRFISRASAKFQNQANYYFLLRHVLHGESRIHGAEGAQESTHVIGSFKVF